MDKTGSIRGSSRDKGMKLLEQWKSKIAGSGHGLRDCPQVKQFHAARRLDGVGSSRGNNSGACLSTCQRRFKVEHRFECGGVAEDGLDCGRAQEAVQKLHA